MENKSSNFKERLRALRKEFGLTQSELGEKINAVKQLVSNYEAGVCEPKFERLIAISDYFGVSMDYLFGRENSMEQAQNSYSVLIRGDNKEKIIALPDYGEVKIVCHDGKVKTVETTVKEKI